MLLLLLFAVWAQVRVCRWVSVCVCCIFLYFLIFTFILSCLCTYVHNYIHTNIWAYSSVYLYIPTTVFVEVSAFSQNILKSNKICVSTRQGRARNLEIPAKKRMSWDTSIFNQFSCRELNSRDVSVRCEEQLEFGWGETTWVLPWQGLVVIAFPRSGPQKVIYEKIITQMLTG